MDKMDVSSIGSGSGSGARPGSPSQQSSSGSDQVVESLAPGVDPEEDSNHYMAILIESLSILGRVQDALDVRIASYGQSYNATHTHTHPYTCIRR